MHDPSALEELKTCYDASFVSLREEPEFELCIVVDTAEPDGRFEIRW